MVMFKRKIELVVLLMLFFGVIVAYTQMPSERDATYEKIKRLNTCKQDSDCEVIIVSHSYCLSCFHIINKKNRSIYDKLLSAYDSKMEKNEYGYAKFPCMYECFPIPEKLECINNKCVSRE